MGGVGVFVLLPLFRNNMSGFGVQQLASKAQRAGAGGVDSFATAGRQEQHRGTVARDLMRGLLKGSTMPPPYWAQVPGKDPQDW